MNVLVIDIGGTNIKFLATGQEESRKFPSGRSLTPAAMVSQLQELTQDWNYDVVAIGYPGLVLKGHIVRDPNNLAPGWIGFDFEAALGRPVKIINDAAMQALGSYQGGTMLFLSLGTGLGSALVVNGVVVPMELGHLAYKKGTFEQYLGKGGLARLGKKKWLQNVEEIVNLMISVLELDEVVIGGGNVKHLQQLPNSCRAGNNSNAFLGGFHLWENA
jgi:predicted NBD/HSP70 family sugar kinase